jgi:Fe-S-cluster containining protein
MIEQLPCRSCTAKCCGPVAITRARFGMIREHLRNMPHAERERLAKQKRGDLDCGFIDKADHRCTIYPVRPWVCEVFGRTEGMVCPQVGHLVQIMPAFLVDQGFAREGVDDYTAVEGLIECRGNEKPAGMSDRWNWREMDFDR